MENEFDTEFYRVKHRNGSFRGLLREVDRLVQEQVNTLWDTLPEPKAEAAAAIGAHAGFHSAGKGVLRDLVYRMIAEQAAYRHNIHSEYGNIYDVQGDTDLAMTIDESEIGAEHLAARRAEARFSRSPIPETRGDYVGTD